MLDLLIRATTYADVEAIWHTFITSHPTARMDWGVRWTFTDIPNVSFISGNRGDKNWRILPQHPPDFVSPSPIRSVHHPDVGASFFLAGVNARSVRNTLSRLQADALLLNALAFSWLIIARAVSTSISRSVMDCGAPLLLVDASGVVHQQSRTATTLLARHGVELRPSRQLGFTAQASQRLFGKAIAGAFEAGEASTAYLQGLRFSVSVPSGLPVPMATVALKALLKPAHVDLRELQLAFSLTLAQAQVAQALVAGEDLSAYAERHDLTLRGVKWHLSQLMQRLDCRRRDQLVATLARLAE